MQFTKSILVSAFAIIGASAAPCGPTDPLPGGGSGGAGAGGAGGAAGTPCGVNQTQYYGSCTINPLGLIGCLTGILNSQSGFCCNNNNGHCTANSGVLTGNTINICVIGGILGPCGTGSTG